MYILYRLYKIFDQIKQGTMKYDKGIEEFKIIYNNALKQCILETDDNFYKALDKFRNYYRINISNVKSCTNGKCPTLPELTYEYEQIDPKTPMIGYKLVQSVNNILYKELTKITKEKHKNLKDLVFLQYNLLFEPDEDENKRLLMNILYEYFQYCYENKNNKHLLEFIEEFINKYYKNMKTNYKKIFQECDPNKKYQDYCDIYNKCNTQFNEDFSLIKNNTVMYVTHKKDYFNNLTTDDSWIGRAMAIFKDFDAFSKNSPTVMSTLVAIALCLFFLYKLISLSSIFRKEKKRKKIPLFFPERINDENSANKNVKPKRGKIIFSYQQT
ncbi:hypothetical protein PVPAM_060007900 [Plasmodium vivax]|nr:hypothetical protein PVPAM_060007900 [Plasmodium vivax]